MSAHDSHSFASITSHNQVTWDDDDDVPQSATPKKTVQIKKFSALKSQSLMSRVLWVQDAEDANARIAALKRDPMYQTSAMMKAMDFANGLDPSGQIRRSSIEMNTSVLTGASFAKKAGLKVRRLAEYHSDLHTRSRTPTGAITGVMYDAAKRRLRIRKEIMDSGVIGGGEGHFTPQNQAFRPVGGDIVHAEKKKSIRDGTDPDIDQDVFINSREKKPPTDIELMQACTVVPINSQLDVELGVYDEELLRIRMTDTDHNLLGRNVIPRSLIIQLSDIEGGTPDLMVSTDRMIQVWGIPRKDKCVWKTKELLVITPQDKVSTPPLACPEARAPPPGLRSEAP